MTTPPASPEVTPTETPAEMLLSLLRGQIGRQLLDLAEAQAAVVSLNAEKSTPS